MRTQLLTLDHLVQLMDPDLYLHLQRADSTNFFFFFRMLLVWFKREFEWTDVLRLWETLWTDFLSSNFHLFIALAILEKHKDVIMEHLKHFDEVLKYSMPSLTYPLFVRQLIYCQVNELSNSIDLASTLVRAQYLFRRFQRTVEAIDRKQSFPAPNIRQRKPAASDTTGKGATIEGKGAATTGNDVAVPGAPEPEVKVISPELRNLLSRKIEKLDKKIVVEHGGGIS